MPKRGDIQCIGHWDQENGSKVRFSMHWTLSVDQKSNLFEFSLNIKLFSLPQESCISYNSGVPAEMEMRFTRFDIRTYLQLELTLNQLIEPCKSKSNLLTITCPKLDSQFLSTLKFHIFQQHSVIYTFSPSINLCFFQSFQLIDSCFKMFSPNISLNLLLSGKR